MFPTCSSNPNLHPGKSALPAPEPSANSDQRTGSSPNMVGSQSEVKQYVDAILSGVASGLINIVDMVTHPIDNILYPMSMLAYDAIIIHTAHNVPSPLNFVLHQYMQNNPHMYHDAISRMEGRINHFKQAGVRFMEASGQQRVEVLAELATGVLVPGYFLQGMKYISAVARSSIANRIEFGTFSQPPYFNNVRVNEASTLSPKFETFTSSQIQSRSGANNYLWVITTDNNLLIASREVESVAHRLGLILPDEFKISQLHHHQLAGLKPVLAAGELTVEGSLIKCITDLSGHYLPVGQHLPYLVERTFQRFGFKDAAGKYQPYVPIAGLTPVARPDITFPVNSIPLNITPGIGSLATSTAATGTNFMAESRAQQSSTNNLNSAATTIAIAQSLATAPVPPVATPAPAPATVNFKAECQKRFQTHNYIAPPAPFGHCLNNNSLFNSTFSPRVNSFTPTSFLSTTTSYFGTNSSCSLSNSFSLNATASAYFRPRYSSSSRSRQDEILDSKVRTAYWAMSSALRSYYGEIPIGTEFRIRRLLEHSPYERKNSLSVSDFSISLVFSGLLKSYDLSGKWGSPWSLLRHGMGVFSKYFKGEVGGVATDVAVISDMVDSSTHAEAEDYFLCFPTKTLPASDAMIRQIKAEMADAYFNHDTLPFFSLHFNQHGFLYPVIHPAFEHTLTGNIIGMLDYWMKGFLNGGVFDEAFLQGWHESGNCDENMLRSMMIDLKKYCREQHISYFSIRELESRYGLEQTHSTSTYSQPFMTSFRIISFQEKIERHGNVLVPSPTFRIEYTVDMMPDYKEYVDAHIREHGAYPPDHQKILNCYEQFAEEIKNTMPQLPFCRDYFQLLGVMSSLSYFYVTLDKMGKRPVIEIPANQSSYHFPKALPPIPVRYYRTYPLSLDLETVLKKLLASDQKKALFDSMYARLFSEKSVLKFPANLQARMQRAIEDLIRERMANNLSPAELQELNEEESGKIAKQASRTIASVANSHFRTIHKMLDSVLTESRMTIMPTMKQRILNSPVLVKIEQINRELKKHEEHMTQRWEAHPEAVKKEAFLRMHPQLHPKLKKEFERIETSLNNVVHNLLEFNDEMEQQERKVIEKIEAHRGIINQNIAECRKEIADLQAHQRGQIASIPPGQYGHYHSQIQALNASIDKGIAHYNGQISNFQTTLEQLAQALKSIPEQTRLLLAKQNEKALTRVKKCFEDNKAVTDGASAMFEGFINDEEKEPFTLECHKTVIINQACKEYALRLLNNYVQTMHAMQERTRETVLHFSDTLFALPRLCRLQLADVYTHAFIGFSGKALDEQTGERFKISGGCGLSMPAMESSALEHGAEFIAAMGQSSYKDGQDSVTFTHNGSKWVAHKIPVRDHLTLDLASTLDTADKPQYVTHDGNHPVHLAAQDGDLDELTRILSDTPDQVHVKNSRDMTPLMAATQFGQLAAIELLHAKGADFNYCSPNGLFPFYVAIERNFHAVAFWMLENVSNLALNQQLDTHVTPLHVAIQHESIDLAKRLIEKGARCDIPRKSDGYTALHVAAILGCVELLVAMRERGLALDTPLESKKTPLHLAAMAGETKTLEYLLSQTSLLDAQTLEGDTALMLAIKAGQAEAARLLAQHTPINMRNAQQQSASLLALIYGMPLVADTLIARGEDPFLRDKQGENYLHYLVRNGEYQRFKRLQQTHEVDINQHTHACSLLAVAAQQGHFLLVNLLQDAGAVFVSNTGKSLMDYAVLADDIGYLREYQDEHTPSKKLAALAARQGSLHCLEWLMKSVPVSVAILKNGIMGNHEKIIALLLKRFPNLNALVDDKGNSLIHLAVTNGSTHAVTQLLSQGCLPQTRNHAGDTAFHIAVKQQDADMLKRLFKLSRPGDWPADLWDLPAKKRAPGLMRVLQKYQKRLPLQSKTSKQADAPAQQLNNTPLLTPATREQLATLNDHIVYQDFAAATVLLRESRDLPGLFQSAMGGKLLQQIIGNISEHDDVEEELLAGSGDAKKPIDALLGFLREHGLNPSLYTGKNNPLLALLAAEKDSAACYQLDVFSRHFPDCIPVLAEDKPLGKLNLAILAIKKNKPALFEKLDAICRQQANTTYSGLHEAVRADNYALTERMLRIYPVDKTNRVGQTAFMIAAARGNIPIINLLVRHGASRSAQDIQGQHALHYALDSDDDKAALTLLPLLEQPNLPNRFGVTPLMLAAEKGMVSVLRLLCDAGQYLKHHDQSGQNALHYAARKGQSGSMEYLISFGFACDEAEVPANPGKAHRCLKRTALHLTALGGYVEAALRLLQLGADPLKEDSQGNTFNEYAVRSKNQRLLNLTKLMPFYHQTERDSSLLHAAAQADNAEILTELLLDGVDINAVNKYGRSALHLAAIHNAPEVLDILVDDPEVARNACDHWGNTALHYAARHGFVRLIERLLQTGVKADMQNEDGCTPLWMACEQGKHGAVLALLKASVNRSIVNSDGLSPCDIALKQGHIHIASQLKNQAEARKRYGFYPSLPKGGGDQVAIQGQASPPLS